MNVTAQHIQSKKRIGSLKGVPVVEVRTTGGLYMVVCQKSGVLKTLGTGSHRAVARFIAEKNEPEMEITELTKSDDISVLEAIKNDPVTLAKYEELTRQFNNV